MQLIYALQGSKTAQPSIKIKNIDTTEAAACAATSTPSSVQQMYWEALEPFSSHLGESFFWSFLVPICPLS